MRTRCKIPNLACIMEEIDNAQDSLLAKSSSVNGASESQAIDTGTTTVNVNNIQQFRPNSRPVKLNDKLKALLVQNKLWMNARKYSRNTISSDLISPASLCKSCISKHSTWDNNYQHMSCLLCSSRIPLVLGNVDFRGYPGVGSGRRRFSSIIGTGSKKSQYLWRDILAAICTAGRKFYGVWSTVLVVWVLTLVLICDLQSYFPSDSDISRTTIFPPKRHERVNEPTQLPRRDSELNVLQDQKSGHSLATINNYSNVNILQTLSSPQSYVWDALATFGVYRKEVSVAGRVRVQVFYEPLCPDSRHFIRSQVTPAMDSIGEHIDLQLVPYGKATTIDEGGQLSFRCQHGPTECLANKVHGCVVREVADQAHQIQIVDCMIEDNYKPKLVGQKCVVKVLGKGTWAPIQKCYTSRKGDQILKHMGSITHSLDPGVSFIPTVTIDGSQDDQRHILQDLTKSVCKRLKTTYIPEACSAA